MELGSSSFLKILQIILCFSVPYQHSIKIHLKKKKKKNPPKIHLSKSKPVHKREVQWWNSVWSILCGKILSGYIETKEVWKESREKAMREKVKESRWNF